MKHPLMTTFLSVIFTVLPISSYAQGNSGMGGGGMGGGDDGGNEPTLYTLSSNLVGDITVGGANWESSNNSQIHYKNFWEEATGVLNLNYFHDKFGGFRGQNCFKNSSKVFAAIIGQKKGGGASVQLWFEGVTGDFVEGDRTPVLYRLHLEGQFVAGDWLPAGLTRTEIDLWTWTMHLENQGKNVKNRSCLGEEDEDTENFTANIYITKN